MEWRKWKRVVSAVDHIPREAAAGVHRSLASRHRIDMDEPGSPLHLERMVHVGHMQSVTDERMQQTGEFIRRCAGVGSCSQTQRCVCVCATCG